MVCDRCYIVLRDNCAVWSDTATRGVFHGSHEHRHVPASVRGESKLPDCEGWNAATSRHTCQPDRHHPSITPPRSACRRYGSGIFFYFWLLFTEM